MSLTDFAPDAHRLAMELECLLLDCTDTRAVSKWWDSANEALDQHRAFCATIEVEATKPQKPGAWKGLTDVQWMNIVNHDNCYLNQDKEDAVHLAVKLTEARLKGNNTTPQPCPKCAEGMVSVTKEDANNYCRILTLLGMEEEGSPVEGVERLISLRDGMTCGDCNDTGWLENREEGRYPCTCMTEAEPYQLLLAERDALKASLIQERGICTDYIEQRNEVLSARDAMAMQNQQMREALTLWKIASDNSEECEFDDMAAYSTPMPLFCDVVAAKAALTLPDTSEIIKRRDAAVLDEVVERIIDAASIGGETGVEVVRTMIKEIGSQL